MHDHNDKSEAEFRPRYSHMRNDISSTDTLYLGIASKPKIWVLLLLPKLRVVSVISWSSCRSATHPPTNAILRYREYQQVTAAAVPASSTGKYFSRSPSAVENGDGMPATQELWFVCCAYPRR